MSEQIKKPTLFDEFKDIPMVFKILAFVPILGIANGGALGGAIGGACCWSVIAIAKKDLPFATKLALVAITYLLGIGLFIGLATLLLSVLPH